MDSTEKKTRQKSKSYPANTLNQSISFIEKFKDYPLNKPISYSIAAKECGVSSTTKSFRYNISSARQFGLLSTSTGETFTLLEPAYRLLRPTEPETALKLLRIQCFSTPALYSELISSYNGKSLPSISTLENLLINYHGIVAKVANEAATVFINSANEAGAVQNGILGVNAEYSLEPNEETTQTTQLEQASEVSAPTSNNEDISIAKGEFAAPLNISFGDERRAILHMPIDATTEDAIYVKDMISLMFKRVYGVSDDK